MRQSFNLALILSLTITCQLSATAQELSRRVFLGIRMENLTEAKRNELGIKSNKGVLVSEVLANSSAEDAKFQKNDVLVFINGKDVNTTTEVMRALATAKTGDAMSYELIRNNRSISGKGTWKSYPTEKYSDLDVIYSHSSSSIGSQRIIITKPGKSYNYNKKLPVIAFIGGIGCYSLDLPSDSLRSEIQFLNRMARAGYMTARLEKPGIGDNANHCKPCNEVSFLEESNSYAESIKELKKRDDVDPDNIYIFGHSMGGVFAPIIAQETSLKGIIAYGTIGSNFQEHLAKTRRTIAEAYSMSPEETDDFIKNFCACTGYYFVDKMSSDEAAAKMPVCKQYMSLFDLRSRAYNNELYALNIPGLWKEFTGKALLLWGESDFVASKEDHQIITDAVNYYHPGNGTFKGVPKSSHPLNRAEDYADAVKDSGIYNDAAAKIVLNWLELQSKN